MKDRNLLLYTVLFLAATGVVMVFSTTGIYADTEYHNTFFFLQKEIIWLSIAFVMMVMGYRINLSMLRQNALPVFVLALILVSLTYSPLGVRIGGAERWIRLGVFNFQPSEFLKLALVFFLSSYLGSGIHIAKDLLKGFLSTAVFTVIAVVPVLNQPDFGTSVMMITVACIILFVSGARFKYIAAVSGILMPVMYYFIIISPYRMKRVLAFLDPWADPQGNGFQIVQSFLAIGRGGMEGVGLGESTQKLFYLPAAHTDFIFSILAEELGFIGGTVIITCFAVLTITGFFIAMRSRDSFCSLLATGLTSLIALQAVMNIAVVTGSVPTKGIPLPFISFGGSNLIMNFLAAGIIMNISKHSENALAESRKKPGLVPRKPYRIFLSHSRHQGQVLV